MSPQSRGRKPRQRKSRSSRGAAPPRPVRPATELLRDAREVLAGVDVLQAELWASAWLGLAWAASDPAEGQIGPLTLEEEKLVLEVVALACDHPSPAGRAAVTALARLGAVPEPPLAAALARLAAQEAPRWETAQDWQPVSAAQVSNVWGDVQMLCVEFAGPVPHALGASIYHLGGALVTTLVITTPGAKQAYEQRPPAALGLPSVMQDVAPAQALADLAAALACTDDYWPRQDEETVVDLRAIVWQRVAPYLTERKEFASLIDRAGDQLVTDFLAGHETDAERYLPRRTARRPARSLARLLLEFGETNLPHRLAWSPSAVALLLQEVLPSQHWLTEPERKALQPVLEGWIRFALDRRGLAPELISEAVDAVAESHPVFLARIDDPLAWGPIKRVAAALRAQNLDLTDPVDGLRHLLRLTGTKRDG